MAKFRMVRTDFWKNPVVSEEMTPEDKYFYLYLLTNPHTTQIGIYKITKKQMAFDLGYSIEAVHSLMERFIEHHKVIRYNPETRELAIKNWGKYNLHKGGKPVMDCMYSELKDVEDLSLILYVSESIDKQEILTLFESFCGSEDNSNVVSGEDENDSYIATECEALDELFVQRDTIRGQKEKGMKNINVMKKQQKEQVALNSEGNPDSENRLQNNQKDVKEIVEFWDNNGFGFSNVNAKQQLLSWLDDSIFTQPKEVILKAMNIACANNKRRLTYVVGILKNWENDSLHTVEEIDSYYQSQNAAPKHRKSSESLPAGRAIPGRFKLDLTAGEEE